MTKQGYRAAIVAWSLSIASVAHAAPVLWLTSQGGSSSAGSVVAGNMIQLDLHFDSGDLPVGGLAYSFSATAPSAGVTYPASSVSALSAAFVSADVSVPVVNSTLDDPAKGITSWLLDNEAAIPASAIARHAFNVSSSLLPGDYLFTPLAQELVYGSGTESDPIVTVEQFGAPGTYTLTVLPVPEPAMLGILALGVLAGTRRRTRSGRQEKA